MQRILVIANATCPCPELRDTLLARAEDDARVLVVAPALNGRLAHWLSDTEGAVRRAKERLGRAIDGLREHGVAAEARVGDADPKVAIADWVHEFAPTELVISTHPPGDSHWLEAGLVEHARERYPLPVAHFVTPYGVDEPDRTTSSVA